MYGRRNEFLMWSSLDWQDKTTNLWSDIILIEDSFLAFVVSDYFFPRDKIFMNKRCKIGESRSIQFTKHPSWSSASIVNIDRCGANGALYASWWPSMLTQRRQSVRTTKSTKTISKRWFLWINKNRVESVCCLQCWSVTAFRAWIFLSPQGRW